MTERLDIPAQEAHVVRVLDVAEDPQAPLADADVLAALGAGGDLRTDEIELFDVADLGDMPLSTYLAEGHGIAQAELASMRGRLDGLTGRVLILPSRAFGGSAMTLRVGAPLRLVGRFEEDVPPAQFDTLPSGGARGSGTAPAAGSQPGMRRAALVLLALLVAVAALVLVLVGGA